MKAGSLFTIGHGRRSAGEFTDLLKEYGIHYLIDIRSVPYSRFNPQYNRPALQQTLEQEGIRYVFMGDALGGRPKDPLCYSLDGRVDYNAVIKKEFFKEGIARLVDANAKGFAAAVMCSESKPQECHRSRLVGQALFAQGISLRHIDEKGALKDHALLAEEFKLPMPG